MHNMTKAALILASGALLLGGCASKVPLAEKPPVVERAPEAAPPVDSRRVEPVATRSVDPLDDPQGVLAKRSVYFDYDSYVVRDDGKAVVENHSAYLNKNKGRKILIQGNTDERGGTEYNLALGQKRAEAVRQAMTLSGASDAQIEAVSLGKEKPKAQGHDEAAWAENRRADIVYK
jgi:peptidoglycan-associated lipoprotein